MRVSEALEQAQGGQLIRKLGELAGISPSDAKRALEAMCPPIAARLQGRAAEPREFERLLNLLEDNESDLLKDGDPSSSEVESDGQAVLADLYGSPDAARQEAETAARALRIDTAAMERLQPIAAQLVLALLSARFRREEEPEGETGAASEAEAVPSQEREGKSIWAVFVAAIGAAIVRALISRLMPRRRRVRYTYDDYRRRTPRRRRTAARPRLEDLFRDLIR
jgi:YD repeat-containing protein